MAITIEYDDGIALPKEGEKDVRKNDRHPLGTPRNRERGFYIGERKIPIGFMRVSEMKPLEDMLNNG